MKLHRITLSDFRNFERATVEFGDRFTVLSGPNGAGKSNLLEALYLCSTLRSFRGAELATMLRRGTNAARVAVRVDDERSGLVSELELRIERGSRSTRRHTRVDGKLIRAGREVYGRLSAVLFTPEDLAVLRGPPSGRRRFLDRVLFARDPSHIQDVQDYEKLLRARNRLLKDHQGARPSAIPTPLFESHEAGLADYGARIWTRRSELVAEIRPLFARAFAQIHTPLGAEAAARDASASRDDEADAGARELVDARAGLAYLARLDADEAGSAIAGEAALGQAAAEAGPAPVAAERAPAGVAEASRRARLLATLAARRGEELRRGSTAVGPHRDELEVRLDGALAADFASQGQSRALVLAFKIAELRLLRQRGRRALLLLDDVSSELDPRRNAALFETLADEVGQCILTTTAPEFIRVGEGQPRLDLRVLDGRILP